ncbi:MAG: TlpA family protein disulfide reductase, partial [Chitinophagales bacterium]
MKLVTPFLLFIEIVFFSCTHVSHPGTRVALYVSADPGEKIYLTKIPYLDEKNQPVDSALVKSVKDSIIFTVPTEPDRLYEIQVKSSYQKFSFIPDAPYIKIEQKDPLSKPTITGSPATVSLRDFSYRQNEIGRHVMRIKSKMDSLEKNSPSEKIMIDSLRKNMNDSFSLIRERTMHYADTVKNPAAFLSVYNNIDFGDNDSGRSELKKFILHASARFPASQPVQKLKQEVLDMISIYEEEFNVGDSLPSISLPDINGNLFSTASLKGKYYLLDLWSTWCKGCWVYDQYKRKIRGEFPPGKFEMVSVALDDDRKTWSGLVRQAKYDWPQLIDEKMWRGIAAQTLKFDSIPFNFLVAPNGRVVAKAIPADSLLP